MTGGRQDHRLQLLGAGSLFVFFVGKRVGREDSVAERPFDLPPQDLEFQPIGQHDEGVEMRARDTLKKGPDSSEFFERRDGAPGPAIDHCRHKVVERLPTAIPSE